MQDIMNQKQLRQGLQMALEALGDDDENEDTNMGDVINLDAHTEMKALQDKINGLMIQAKEKVQQARELYLEAGEIYLEGRAKCASDQEFGNFCAGIEYGWSQQDVHFLMTLALNKDRVLKISAMLESKAVSPRRWLAAINHAIDEMGMPTLRLPREVVGNEPVTDMSVTASQSDETPSDTTPDGESDVLELEIQDSETKQPEETTPKPQEENLPQTPEEKLLAGFSRVLNKNDAKTVKNKMMKLSEPILNRVADNAHKVNEMQIGTPKSDFVKSPWLEASWISPILAGNMVSQVTWNGDKWTKETVVTRALPIIEWIEGKVATAESYEKHSIVQSLWKKHYIDKVPLGEDYPDAPEDTELSLEEGYEGKITICGVVFWKGKDEDNDLSWKETAGIIMMWYQMYANGIKSWKKMADIATDLIFVNEKAGKLLHRIAMTMKDNQDQLTDNYRDFFRGPNGSQFDRLVGRNKTQA
jgi:hypothetical protein